MNILIAPDAFKGSLTAQEAATAIAAGLHSAWPEAALRLCPLTDGGEGFLDVLVLSAGATLETAATTDARGVAIEATYAVLDGGRTVAIELASAAGLVQLRPEDRDPLLTTTAGVGALIAQAYARHGFKKLLLALGGSATVDGGAGMLTALGVRLLNASGAPIAPGGGGLAALASIDLSRASPLLREAEIVVAVDVDNPLIGARGAAPVYGPQKGASPEVVATLAANLAHFADVLEAATGNDVRHLPGTGSAGGVPAGLVALANAHMTPGFELAAQALDLTTQLTWADVVVTGEGQLDRQSFEGKVVGRLASRCAALGLPLIVLAGRLDPDGEARLEAQGGVAFSLVSGPMTYEAAVAEAPALLTAAAGRVGRLIKSRTQDWGAEAPSP